MFVGVGSNAHLALCLLLKETQEPCGSWYLKLVEAFARPDSKMTSVAMPASWLEFKDAYELVNADIEVLRSEQPWELDEQTITFLILRLHETLKSKSWGDCEVVLSILIRSDLKPVLHVAARYGLGALAKQAMNSHKLDAPSAEGAVARFGRVLFLQLCHLVDQLED